jgi:hypothetical protein
MDFSPSSGSQAACDNSGFQMTTYARLGYNIHVIVMARRCASARLDSRDQVTDSVLIAGQAGTAAGVRSSVEAPMGELAADRRADLRFGAREVLDCRRFGEAWDADDFAQTQCDTLM